MASAAAVSMIRAPLTELSLNSLQDSIIDSEAKSTTKSRKSVLPTHIDLTATHLISSPYPDLGNQLRLEGLETPYQLFAFAMIVLKPTRDDYATAPYLDSFNWSDVFALLRQLCQIRDFEWQTTSFYTVTFRSKLKENIDRTRLGLLDQKSHEEACQSGGLLKYWFGSTDADRRNLATCLWRSHADAVAGGAGPWHKQARGAAREMYESISFHVHELVVEAGAETWTLKEYVK